MKKVFKNAVLGAAALCMAVGTAGCGSNEKNDSSNKLTYWMELESNAAMSVSDYGETPFAKELEKRLGIDIEYQHPPQGQGSEKFNVMVAMDDMPDIIEYRWASYPGGPSRAISEGIIRDIGKELDKAPNFKKYLHLSKGKSKGVERNYFLIFKKFFQFFQNFMLTIIYCLLWNTCKSRPLSFGIAVEEQCLNQLFFFCG